MTLFDDVMTLENGCDDETSFEDQALAMQRVINDGQGWHMQGSMGRSMMAAIEAGDCLLGPRSMRDYYGNRIPSRTEVKAGTKGSREYVVAAHGEAWAEMMEGA